MLGRRGFLQATGGLVAAGAVLGPAAQRALAGGCLGATVGDGSLARFRSRIAGSVVLPADAGYASARQLFNLRFDPFPVMVVRAADESDVARTIEFARVNGIALAIRSGGHSYIGASGGSGIVLDLSGMGGVASLGGAMFRVGSATQLQAVYGELRCNGNWTLPAGSCPSVNLGGIALGGGFGYRQRAHGLTCDRVRAARMVLADGTAVDASPDGDVDLHWAVRGGGSGFGVVTHLDVEAVPYRTLRIHRWRWPLASVGQALARMIELHRSEAIPRSVTGALVCNGYAAAASPAGCLCLLFGNGIEAELDHARELLTGPGGVPMLPGSFSASDDAVPPCSPTAVPGRAWYRAKSAMVFGDVPADTGERIAHWMQARLEDPLLTVDDYCTINFFATGGAMRDVGPSASAYPHREAHLEVQFLGYVQAPAAATIRANERWIRGAYADLFPRLSAAGAGCYLNYCDDDLAESQWPGLYWGSNYPRLQSIKSRVDPDDLFRGRQTVRPAHV